MQRLRNSLALRLTVWFLLLSFLPLAVMTIFVRRNVADAFVELEAHYHGNQARALAAATSLLGDGEGDAAQALLAATIDGHHAVFIVDENGAYVAHSDEDKVAGSAYDDFSTGVVEQFLIGGDGTMVEAETGRVIGYSVVPGHGASEDQSVAVVVTNRPAMSALMSDMERLSFVQLAISLAIVSIVGGAAIWTVVGSPIRQLTGVAEQIGAGNLEIEVDPDDMEDELKVLASTFNQMTRRLRELVGGLEQHVAELKRAEEALGESHERLLTILDSIDADVYVADMETYEILFMNQHMRASFGKDLVGEICWNVFRGASGPCTHCTNDQLLDAEGYPTGVVIWEGHNPITGNWYINYDRAIKWVDDRLVRVQVATDITGPKRSEEALRDSEERLSSILEHAGVGILVIQDGQQVFYNAKMYEMLGYTEAEYKDIHYLSLVHPEDQPLAVDRIRQRLTGAATDSSLAQMRILAKSGEIRWVETSSVRIQWGGQPAIQAFILDITERKRAEEEGARLAAQVREQARQMEQVLATVPAGVLLLDVGGRVLQANPTAQKDLTALAGAKVGDALTHLGDRPLAELLTAPPTRGLWHEVKADKRTFEVIARPVENGSEPEHWVLVVNDVTREREIQAQLQQQERLAAVGQLAAGIAHDFNNIMASIVLYAQMAARSPELSERDRERMAVINQQAWHASQLIDQILDFSRRAVLERRFLDLLPLLKEQVRLLERTLPEHIRIELNYGQEEYTAHADPTRIQQMLTNLAVNARDVMPDGGILRIGLERITVEHGKSPLLPEMEAGEWTRLTVSDTGTGIPPNVLPHIFEPFFTTKGPGEGSGLGLAQVHGIVGQHGGRIDVETRVGEGTTFAIYLPVLEVRPSEPPLSDLPAIPQGHGEVVLVVEDETTLRAALVASLEQSNYQALEAANGEQALTMMEEQGEQITLILSDVVMPAMGGIALFHALRERGWQTPVILLTGHPMEKELEALQGKGLSGWLTKPPSFERLAQALADALRR